MDKLVKTGRLVFLAFLLLALVAVYFATLYKLQIVEGDAYYEESQNNIVTTVNVTAARGNIHDRYGRVLVSNRSCSNLYINSDELFEQEDPNAVILELCRTVEACGETYIDEFPVTMTAPFEYTEMTTVQRVCLEGYLENAGLDADASAVELMAWCRDRYDIADTYTSEETRIIAGIRYELNMRYIVKTSDYVFAEDVSIECITSLMESGIPGFTVDTSYVREYNTIYAAQLLGYTGYLDESDYDKYKALGYKLNAKVGKEGAEYAFESYLHGTDGEAKITSTASGTVTSTVYTDEPEPGDQVYLTIDIGMQEAAEQSLSAYITATNEERQKSIDEETAIYGEASTQLITGGAVAVVQVGTGEPLTLASYPSFNPSTMLEDYDELLADETGAPLVNRALSGLYAPGSTFKPCVSIAGLDSGKINTGTTIYDNVTFDKYADAGYAPKCWSTVSHGDCNVTRAICVSCNYFFYQLGDWLGIDAMNKYAKMFGLGESTGIELPENTGHMASPEYKASLYGDDDFDGQWFQGDTLSAAIGQSISQFTPLQIANYIATIADGGKRYSCSLLKSVRSFDYSESVYEREPDVLSEIDTAEENWDAVRLGMWQGANTPEGTGYSVFGNYAYCEVATKTGTAQMGENKTNNAIFVCYAPYDDPEIAVCVVVEKGSAGSAIAEIAKDVLDYYFSFKESTSFTESENTMLK